MMFPPTLQAVHVSSLPDVDGEIDEVWAEAPRLRVNARGNTQKEQEVPVELRAVHSEEGVAFLFRWEDDTQSDSLRQVEWSATGEPMVTGVPDDQMALKFNLGGSRFSCMLAGKPVISDVWSWKAARTDPTGYAQDRLFIVRGNDEATPEGPEGTAYRALNGKPIEIIWKEDEGDPLVLPHPATGTPGEVVPEITRATPSGSQADVRARGSWKDGIWSVEFARRFDTGYEDDAPIAKDNITKFSIAVFDESEGQVHANTRSIKLKPLP